MPCLPVLSASNCSSHAPRSRIPGDVTSVTLLCPRLARVPRIAPRITPGFSPAGTVAAQAWIISSVRSSRRRTSSPIIAPGTMPKFDSAEYRPPMLGTPKKIRRKWSASATCCNFDPGSVMASTSWPGCSLSTVFCTRSKKYCLKMFGSSVAPDLLDTMNNVLAMSICFSMDLICAGSVESKTCNSGWPSCLPKVSFSTSGQRLDPPIPSKRACLNPALMASAAASARSWRCAAWSSATCSQPSHLSSSSLVQTVC